MESRSPSQVISNVHSSIEYVRHHDLRNLIDAMRMSLLLLRNGLAHTPPRGNIVEEPLERLESVTKALREVLWGHYPRVVDGFHDAPQYVDLGRVVQIAGMASQLWPEPEARVNHLKVKVPECEVAMVLALCIEALGGALPASRDELGRQVDAQLRLTATLSPRRVHIQICGPTQLSSATQLKIANSPCYKTIQQILGRPSDYMVSVTNDGLSVSCVVHSSSTLGE